MEGRTESVPEGFRSVLGKVNDGDVANLRAFASRLLAP